LVVVVVVFVSAIADADWQTTPPGLLSLLDEECRFPKSTDLTFLQKICTQHGKCRYLERPKTSQTAFIVKHYAGNVRLKLWINSVYKMRSSPPFFVCVSIWHENCRIFDLMDLFLLLAFHIHHQQISDRTVQMLC
jgi:hypothetical protein